MTSLQNDSLDSVQVICEHNLNMWLGDIKDSASVLFHQQAFAQEGKICRVGQSAASEQASETERINRTLKNTISSILKTLMIQSGYAEKTKTNTDGASFVLGNSKQTTAFRIENTWDFISNLDEKTVFKSKGHFDCVVFVVLCDPSGTMLELYQQSASAFREKYGDYLRVILFKDFILEYFNEQTYTKITEIINTYVSLAEKETYYSPTLLPSINALKVFRKKAEKELINHVSLACYPSNLSSAFEKVKKRYLGNKLYRIMLGDSSFAQSFLSSEWSYQNNKDLPETIEKTFIVAGYIKSIEQLLFEILCLHKDDGFTISTYNLDKDKKRIYTIIDRDNPDIDSSLGSLIECLEYNTEHDMTKMFVGPSGIRSEVKKRLTEWRVKYRNSSMHKDNIYTTDQVETIRENAYSLYFLLLTSFKFSEEDLSALGLMHEEKQLEREYALNAFSNERFFSWIKPHIEYATVAEPFCEISFNISRHTSQEAIINLNLDNNDTWEMVVGFWPAKEDAASKYHRPGLRWKDTSSSLDILEKCSCAIKEYFILEGIDKSCRITVSLPDKDVYQKYGTITLPIEF